MHKVGNCVLFPGILLESWNRCVTMSETEDSRDGAKLMCDAGKFLWFVTVGCLDVLSLPHLHLLTTRNIGAGPFSCLSMSRSAWVEATDAAKSSAQGSKEALVCEICKRKPGKASFGLCHQELGFLWHAFTRIS